MISALHAIFQDFGQDFRLSCNWPSSPVSSQKTEKNGFDNETTAATRMRFHLGQKGPLSRICSGLVFAAVMVAVPVVPSLEMSKVF